jgi:hypothetical protein
MGDSVKGNSGHVMHYHLIICQLCICNGFGWDCVYCVYLVVFQLCSTLNSSAFVIEHGRGNGVG